MTFHGEEQDKRVLMDVIEDESEAGIDSLERCIALFSTLFSLD